LHLFWIGLVFLLLEGNVTLWGTTVNLLPDALGFLLLFVGMTKLRPQVKLFSKGRLLALVFGILSLAHTVVTYALPDLSGTILFGDSIMTLISDVVLLGKLLIIYLMTLGIAELSAVRSVDLKQKPLHVLWVLITCANIPVLGLSVVTANLYDPSYTFVKIAYIVYIIMAVILSVLSAVMIVFAFLSARNYAKSQKKDKAKKPNRKHKKSA